MLCWALFAYSGQESFGLHNQTLWMKCSLWIERHSAEIASLKTSDYSQLVKREPPFIKKKVESTAQVTGSRRVTIGSTLCQYLYFVIDHHNGKGQI